MFSPNDAREYLNGLFLDKLDKGSKGGLRVEKCHCCASAPGPRGCVDHHVALCLYLLKSRGHVIYAIADMMDALSALLEGLGQRGVGSGRGKELNV